MPDRHANGTPSHARPDSAAGGVDASFAVDFAHRLRFTQDAFDPDNLTLRGVLPADGRHRLLVFIDDGVTNADAGLIDRIDAYVRAHDDRMFLAGEVRITPGGERAKNDLETWLDAARAVDETGVCRHSFVVAIGGGAMLDAVGFAAATAHRGVRLIRLPTTTLAQDDAGVGVKNGVNAFGKKNFLGAFAPPWAVINDTSFLRTLSDRDFRAGLSEAVKVALLKDPVFFETLVREARVLAARDEAAIAPVIERSAALHLAHIVEGGDPFEMSAARPLDFGHWSAHKLEQLTDFEVRHGEAVSIGLALDLLYSVEKAGLAEAEAVRAIGCLANLGLPVHHPRLHEDAIFEGLDEFREHLGGALTITLLRDVGDAVDVHEIDRDVMRACLRRLSEFDATVRTS